MKTIRSLLFIAAIVVAASYAYQQYDGRTRLFGSLNTNTQQVADNVLGAASKQVLETTDTATKGVQSVLYKKTATPLVDQFRKLPAGQQEEIKKQICEVK